MINVHRGDVPNGLYQDVALCPHCGNVTSQTLQGRLSGRSGQYFLTACGTCIEATLYRQADKGLWIAGNIKLEQYELLWPQRGRLHRSVPAPVRRCYEEAAAIKQRAPNAFANQIRRALEALCRDRKATRRTLAENLQELAGRGEIPQVLSEMTDILRKFGNIGSHADEEEVGPEYVDAIDDFFRAVVEYVYVAPFRVSEVKAQLDQARKSQPGQG